MQLDLKSKKLREYGMGIMFILPLIIMIILFIAYPVVQSLLLSFFKWKGYGDWNFIGIQNYIRMFTTDQVFVRSLINSIIFTLTVTAGTVGIGFLLALVIDFKIPGWKAYRTLFLIPLVLMQVAISFMWLQVLAPNGALNSVLGLK